MRTAGQLFAFLIVVGFVAEYFWWLLAAAAVVALAIAAARGLERARADAAERRREADEIAQRADQQQAWVDVGDERGVYGIYPPAA